MPPTPPARPDGWVYRPPPGPIPVLHHDRDLVVVDKPAGLLSTPGRGADLADSAWTRAAEVEPRALAVHRLDLDTSGVLCFATRKKAERELFRQFRERVVQKVYVAWVWGRVSRDAGVIDAPLRRLPGRPRSEVHPDGKPAQTRFEVRARSQTATLLHLFPRTGRSHQLRVHCLHSGHPILGDRFYAPPAAQAAAPRLLLHAWKLQLLHPHRGDELRFLAPLPQIFDRLNGGAEPPA